MNEFETIERGFQQAKENVVRACPLENGMLFTISAEAFDNSVIQLINDGVIRPVYADRRKYRRIKYLRLFKHIFRIPWFKKETQAIRFEVINADKYMGGSNGQG